MSRTAPLVASVLLHATVAAGLVASSAAHARARAEAPAVGLEVAVDVLEPLEPVPPPTEAPAPPVAKTDRDEPPPTHTHAYPVAPSHDAHPHDPRLEHAHDAHHAEAAQTTPPAAVLPAAAAPAPAAAAPAAPALTAEGSALPRFTLPSGAGVASSGRVASALATGDEGAGAGDRARAEDATVLASSVEVAARPVRVVEAAYPAFARADDVEGEVALEIVVDREGRVVEAGVTRRAGHGFDEAALAAIRAYRFSPAERQGRAVRVRMPWTVRFRLR
jgi:protein TonB